MTESLLTTKFFIPTTRLKIVPRSRLIRKMNEGLHRKMTLISAPAGFGKTTLVSEWLGKLRADILHETEAENEIVWLSLDEDDNDPVHFLSYFIAALNKIEGLETTFGKGALNMLQSPQPPPIETILTAGINEIAAISVRIIFVLDDYHLIAAQPIHDALIYLLEHLPPLMHLVVATREAPPLPLTRLQAKDQLTGMSVRDLRFTSSEAAEFLNQVMGLDLSVEDIAALETRTEGWIAGLQLAAISLHGQGNVASFIKSFSGSHRLVLDYLIEDVLEQQPENIQTFLLTAILNRLNGSFCDAITGQNNGQATLETLELTNLFIIPLDNERCWYRYHHLFADLLRQRLPQSIALSTGEEDVSELNIRASAWYEDDGLEIEAFQHAVATNDVERAERLIEGEELPLHWRGATATVLNWLESLPTPVLDDRLSLLVTFASVLVFAGKTSNIDQKLQADESVIADQAALQDADPDDKTQDLIGHIAALRAMMAVNRQETETIIAKASRVLELLHPDNLPVRTAANWTLGFAYQIQGDRAAASKAYAEVISTSQVSGIFLFTIAATTSLGQIQEAENQSHLAAQTHQHALDLPPVYVPVLMLHQQAADVDWAFALLRMLKMPIYLVAMEPMVEEAWQTQCFG